jgi:ATP-dependent Zn protease
MIGTMGMGRSNISVMVRTGDLCDTVLSDDCGREDVEAILAAAASAAREMLAGNRQVVEALRDALLERNELVGDEIAEVIVAAQGAAARPPVLVGPIGAIPTN